MTQFQINVAGQTVQIETHDVPVHLDEFFAMLLIMIFGTLKFLTKYAADGVIHLGVGGGAFDEHPSEGQAAKTGSCTTLVAQALGVDGMPSLGQLLKWVMNGDQKADTHPLNLGNAIKVLQQNGVTSQDAWEWTLLALKAYYAEQLKFSSEVEAFKAVSKTQTIDGPRGALILTVINAPAADWDSTLARVARSEAGSRADVVIMCIGSGHVSITTNHAKGLKLGDVISCLRVEEQRIAGSITITDFRDLESDGHCGGIWYFDGEKNLILNGSRAHRDVPPTQLSLAQIVTCVKIGLDPREFEPEHACECDRNICTSRMQEPCPWYAFGFRRCRTVRYRMRQE